MELPGESSSVSKLQHLKADLKQWELEFQKQNGRVPSKQDVQASPSIHSLYREYAKMKLKIPKEMENVKTVNPNLKIRQPDEKENAPTGLREGHRGNYNHLSSTKPEDSLRFSSKRVDELRGVRVEQLIHLPKSRGFNFPATSSNSEESEDDSYVSATPPKRRDSNLELQSTPISSYRPVRRPLQEISAGQLNVRSRETAFTKPIPSKLANVSKAVDTLKRKTAEVDAPKKLTSIPADNTSDPVLPSVGNTLQLPEISQEPGFVIKRRRPGMQLDEENICREVNALPAGFSATVVGFSLLRKECKKASVPVNESSTCEIDERTPGESVTAKSSVLSPSAGTQEKSGFTDENHTALSKISHIDSSASEASLGLQDKCASATQQLSINLQPEFELAQNSNHPISETETNVAARDLPPDSTVKSLQKLTVVTLKQMLLKQGLPVTGIKAILISRLSAALSAEVAGGCPSAENVDGENCKRTENMIAEPQVVEQTGCRKEGTSGARKVESDYGEGKSDVEPSHDSVASSSLRGDELDSPSVPSRTRSRRLVTRGDQIFPSSTEKLIHINSDQLRLGDVEVAGSIPASKRVKRRPRQDSEFPVIPQGGLPKVAIASSIPKPVADDSCLEKEDLNSPSGALAGDVNDSFAPKMSKRKKFEKQPEEQSWSKPKALQRRPRTQNTQSTSGRGSFRDKVRTQTVKTGERNNFVKLNINGRGGGRRKFVNKSHFRKPGAYGRRGYRGKKSRRLALDEADNAVEHDLLHADEVDQVGAFEGKGSRSKRTKSSTIETDNCVEADASHPDRTERHLPPSLSEVLKRVTHDPSNDNLLEVLKLAFGFKAFRAGQLEAVKRVLALQSTMVMLPTGAGKSLCYQLPALVLPGVTLVISPLIALMTDQLNHLPPSLPGALMSSAQTYQESSSLLARLRAGLIKVLFISPERLCSESFQRVLTEIPKINLAVIDEAHCLSEWSHNFRPSYFRLGIVLFQQMKVPCILAMTATATKKAERSIMEALHIPSTGLVQASRVRENIALTVAKEPNRLRALLRMLQASPYSEARSIIIYCTFQVEADNISDFLQQSGIQAKSYHAKKSSQERSRILDHFCNNKLRVVVATVAFGMGLDKKDVRAVIHYNIPRSLEHYVQETGRAGRDGMPAFCHLFLDDNDYLKLRSLAHSEGVDEYAVGKVLSQIFRGKQELSKPGSPSSIIIEKATKDFDMKEEVLETILSYLEVGDVEYVKSVSKLNVTCALSFHRSSPTSLAETSGLVAAVLKRGQEKQGRYVFDMLSLTTQLQISMCDVQFELRRLQIAGEISFEYGDPAFCFTVSRYPQDVCLLTSSMTKRLNDVETSKVRKVDAMYMAALAAVCQKNDKVMEESTSSSSSQQRSLQDIIKQYFDEDEGSRPDQQLPNIIEPNRNFLRADVKDFVRSNKHANLTGRAVARIFYGIWSPAFPYSDWSRNHSWGKYEGVDFGVIKDIATAELLAQHSATRMLQNS